MKKCLVFFIFCVLSISLFSRETVIVGIAGGSGSGKTTLSHKIHQFFPDATLISLDFYYRDQSHLSAEERDRVNFDHPKALEFSLFKEHLIDLKNGRAVEQPIYNFHGHVREKETNWIEPSNIIIVEGILLLAVEEVRDLFDLKIFVDTDDDIRILRRVERDMKERFRDFNSVKKQYLETVKPMHDAFVGPSKKHADIIVSGEVYNQVVIGLILSKLKEYLRS